MDRTTQTNIHLLHSPLAPQSRAVIEFHDVHAGAYDAKVDGQPIAARIRRRIHQRLLDLFKAGDRVLDLQCGTGTDATMLALHGIHVTATDVSPAMIAVAQSKARAAGVEDLVCFSVLETGSISSLKERGLDGIISIFNGLNHIDDLTAFARDSAAILRPGGRLLCTLLNKVCLSELLYFTLKMSPRQVWRRIVSRATEIRDDQQHFALKLYFPAEFSRHLARHFRLRFVEGFGVLMPPAGLHGIYERHPQLIARLEPLEELLSVVPAMRSFADQYFIEMERIN